MSDIRAALIDEIISMYHTTRLRETPVSAHILSKPSVQKVFAQFEHDRTSPLIEALQKLVSACRAGRMVTKPGCGVGGMTIEANIRGSNYNGVDAWAVEEAQAVLDELHARASLLGDAS